MKIHYFINGNGVNKNQFEKRIKDLIADQWEFSIEDRHYWDAGKYQHLKDIIYGEWELRPVRKED